MIYNYVLKTSKDNGVDLKTINDCETINFKSFFEFVSYNNIEFYEQKQSKSAQ